MPKATIKSAIRQTEREKAKSAISWLYSLAPKLKSSDIPPEAFNPRARDAVFIGGMFLYQYDPKHKDTLPWYDSLPLVIPVEVYNDGWLGLNVHYLPPPGRKMLMDKLVEYRKRAASPRAYMQLSYQMLGAAVKSDLFAPCVHRYLGKHLASRIIRIDDKYWSQVAALPIQQFKKASARQVWGSR